MAVARAKKVQPEKLPPIGITIESNPPRNGRQFDQLWDLITQVVEAAGLNIDDAQIDYGTYVPPDGGAKVSTVYITLLVE